MTSSTNTFVEVRAIEATSSAASRVDTAMYLAAEPKPGQQSVMRQIVVDGLGNPDAGDGIAHLHADLGHLVRGIHGIVAAVVEEVADVVRPEYLDQPLVLGAVLVYPGELVARRAEGAAGRVAQGADGRRRSPCRCRSGPR